MRQAVVRITSSIVGDPSIGTARAGPVILRDQTCGPRGKMYSNGHKWYHCKQWVEEGEPHDCWSTTEAALTRHLSDDLREAWERLRETAAAFGEQRIYASHHSIMFSRKSCYFFASLCVRNRNISNCVSSWDGGSKLPRCGV